MKVLFAPIFFLWPHHAGTELELLEEHTERGDEITTLRCSARSLACVTNMSGRPSTCAACINTRGRFLNSNRRISDRPLIDLTSDDWRALAALPARFETIEDLKAFHFESADLGMAVASTLISRVRESSPQPSEHEETIQRLLWSSAAVLRSVRRLMEQERFDRVYVFNGRYAIPRAIVRAAEMTGTPFFIHERGSRHSRYAIFHQALPHDRSNFARRVWRAWSDTAGSRESRESIAAAWFSERAAGVEQAWPSFTAEQRRGKLPSDWDDSKINITFFNSSEDEFAAIDESWRNPLYESQADAIRRVCQSFRTDSRFHFYLRVHPNLARADNSQTRAIAGLDLPNLSIIAASSDIDTYSLLAATDAVCTFGSTVGVEAIYREIPTLELAPSYYMEILDAPSVASHSDVVEWIRTRPPVASREGALAIAHYLSTFGRPFRFYEPRVYNQGSFRGTPIEPTIGGRAFRKALSVFGMRQLAAAGSLARVNVIRARRG